MTDLSLAADTNTGVTLSLPRVDLTGYELELIVAARGISYTSTLDDGLDLVVSGSGDALESLVTWNYTQDQSTELPLGALTLFDLFGTLDGFRSKLAAGTISVDGAGELSISSATASSSASAAAASAASSADQAASDAQAVADLLATLEGAVNSFDFRFSGNSGYAASAGI